VPCERAEYYRRTRDACKVIVIQPAAAENPPEDPARSTICIRLPLDTRDLSWAFLNCVSAVLSKRRPSEEEVIHLFHHTFRRSGGMERYAMSLAAGLRDAGHPVVVHARRLDPAVVASGGVRLDRVRVSRFPRVLRDFRFFRKVDRLRVKASGIQIALTRVRTNDVVVCGGTHRGYLLRSRKLTGPGDMLQAWMETESYRSARVVVSHSKLCREELVRFYRVPPEKIVTLYPPVETDFRPPASPNERAELRRRLGLPEDKVVFLFPSTGHRRKGLQPVCRALHGLSDQVVLAVAGSPVRWPRWPFVRHLGYVQDMATAYRAADFTLLGSLYEPFGLVGVESVRCGTRLVFEENIGCLEIVKPEYVFTFSVWNPDSIRRAVLAAVDLAHAGRHTVPCPAEALRYTSSVTEHTHALLQAATAR
jgi:glycosyltransferase involved in cell wall biosynthesis